MKLKAELLMRQKGQDYYELARPFTLLAPALGFVSGGVIALASKGAPQVFLPYAILLIALGAASAALLNAASNTVNQIFDLEIDKVNKPLRPLPSGRLTLKQAWIFCGACYAGSFLLAWLLPNKQFFVIVLITAFITYAYSGPPFRTKRFGWLANLTMAVPRGCLIIVAGWSALRDIWNPEPWFVGGMLGLFVFGAATTKDFSDIAGDEANGVRTLPIIYGVRDAAWIIAPFFVLPFLLIPYGVIFGVLTGPRYPLTIMSLFLALYGGFCLYLILRDPQELATEANHVSWKHMYLLLVLSQVGVAACYFL